ncbi:putative cationic amino acid transporter [Schistosoma mansoni]|uniref:putative cationic amino acid transporter n=1 Tax=Schistosoma mansoni TaxID=6183 RepID=UPI00022DC44C|nr:putative cationic amino acid transporter [Schistosoma mansoni]|eukprot:XP_018652530.1 putative cationic amino acid transporter [Schistosoma mansoni]
MHRKKEYNSLFGKRGYVKPIMIEEVHELDKINNGRDDIPVVQLKKTIGLASSITIIVGSMIGSGIFVSPTGIMENVNSIGASLIIWVACGLFSMLGAYCYAELGTMIHRSGGDYIYVYEAFGPFFGFLRLWSEVVVARPASVAIMSMTFAKYIAQPIFPDCDQPEVAVRLLAAVCISKVDGLVGAFDNSDWSPGAITKAFYVGLFAYSGWNYLNCMIEEMNNPRRDLPLAIIISCLLVTFIYTMANVAYVTVVSPHEILTTPAVAITFSVRIYGVMWWIMPIFVALSTFGGVNGTVMTTSRMFFVASQVNQMPKLLCFLHMDRMTPISAVVFTCITSICYLFVGDIYSLITYLGFVQWLAIGVCVSIVIVFRITKRNHPRPVKAPILFAIIYVLITLFLVIFAFVAAPVESCTFQCTLFLPVFRRRPQTSCPIKNRVILSNVGG